VRIALPYGRRPLVVDFGDRRVRVAEPVSPGEPAPPLDELLERELAIAAIPPARDAVVIVSDATRAEPRGAFLEALRRRLGDFRIAIATGTHGPARLGELGLPGWATRVVNHDGRSDVVDLGVTARGTPVRVHRCVVEADLVVATGCIRPHYFAGFGAGVKAIFPGLGEATAVRVNHRLKTEPRARAGIVDGNPCRDDLEEAVAMIATPKLLVNGVCDPDGEIRAVVVGDVVDAFRRGVALARPWLAVHAEPASVVVASDRLPVSASLYQAAKIAAAAAPFVKPNGRLVVVAECSEGIEPLETVNEEVWRIGVLPRLPTGARLALVSELAANDVQRTLLSYGPSVEALLDSSDVLVLPRAGQVISDE
jgi:nickel-dependent lactate racemase